MKVSIRIVLLSVISVCMLVIFSGCIASGPTTRVKYNPLVASPPGKRIAVIATDLGGSTMEDRSFMYVLLGNSLESVGSSFSFLLERELLDVGVYRIIERKQLDQVLAEQKFSKSDMIDAETATEIGRLAGVDGVVLVEYITEFYWFLLYAQKSAVGVAKMIEVSTGEVVWSAEVRTAKHSLLPFIPFSSISQNDLAIAMGEEITNKLKGNKGKTGTW